MKSHLCARVRRHQLTEKEVPEAIAGLYARAVIGGALAAAKLNIAVGHVEAGLRCYDMTIPEEVNRVVVDHVSTYLFAPTETSRSNLLKEGISDSKIFVTGNTVVDALIQNIVIAEEKRAPLESLRLDEGGYFLATCHRAENTDNREWLTSIIHALKELSMGYGVPVIYQVHPRAGKMIKEYGIDTTGITCIAPVGYLDFLLLERGASLILTDSGGVQEEACILNIPCVTLRDNTERPETIEVKSNIVAGTKTDNIIKSVETMLQRKTDWHNPYGSGDAAQKIVEITHPNI